MEDDVGGEVADVVFLADEVVFYFQYFAKGDFRYNSGGGAGGQSHKGDEGGVQGCCRVHGGRVNGDEEVEVVDGIEKFLDVSLCGEVYDVVTTYFTDVSALFWGVLLVAEGEYIKTLVI